MGSDPWGQTPLFWGTGSWGLSPLPEGNEGEEVGSADRAVLVEIGKATCAIAPVADDCEQIAHADASITIKIAEFGVLQPHGVGKTKQVAFSDSKRNKFVAGT